MTYLPKFQPQLNGSDPLGSVSCTAYAGAMVGDYHTLGRVVPTGRAVRLLTGDTSGGTTLNQIDYALRKGWNIDLDTRTGSATVSWPTFAKFINAGKAAVLQVGYGPINDSPYQGSETFRGNHAVAVLPGWIVLDPLADGRRAGIYRYRGAAYPESLLRIAASQLVVNPSTGTKAGLRVWCSFSRDNVTQWRVDITPNPGRLYPIYFYRIENGLIVGRDLKHTSGIHAACTPPRLYQVKKGVAIPPKSLVRITEKAHIGKYVQTSLAQEYP